MAQPLLTVEDIELHAGFQVQDRFADLRPVVFGAGSLIGYPTKDAGVLRITQDGQTAELTYSGSHITDPATPFAWTLVNEHRKYNALLANADACIAAETQSMARDLSEMESTLAQAGPNWAVTQIMRNRGDKLSRRLMDRSLEDGMEYVDNEKFVAAAYSRTIANLISSGTRARLPYAGTLSEQLVEEANKSITLHRNAATNYELQVAGAARFSELLGIKSK